MTLLIGKVHQKQECHRLDRIMGAQTVHDRRWGSDSRVERGSFFRNRDHETVRDA
jgi:hypothetical protein